MLTLTGAMGVLSMTFPPLDKFRMYRYGQIGMVGRKIARRYQAWHASPQVCTADSKVLRIPVESISVGFQTTVFLISTPAIAVLRRQEGS